MKYTTKYKEIMQFRQIQDDDFEIIADMQSKTQYNGSEYSMLYLKGWEFFNYKEMQIAFEDGVIYIRFMPHDKYKEEFDTTKYIYLPPLCTLDKVKIAYAKIQKQSKADNDLMYVMATPDEYVEILGDEYLYKHNEDYDEYLYLPENLINLTGKKYHGKRNHINNFIKLYAPDAEGSQCCFRSYKEEDYKKVMALIAGWDEQKEFDRESFDEMKNDEFKVIELGLDMIYKGCQRCFADVVEYNDKIIAFCFGEITPSNVGLVHFEKGDIAYDGVYPFINQRVAQKHFANVRLINRQEDMGLEGLRKSKQSYYPVAFSRKNAVESKLEQ